MPKVNLLTTIINLAKKAGVNTDDAAVKDLTGYTELAKIEIDDSLANSLETNLLTVDSAKNNRDIANHFKAQAFNGLDAELDAVMAELGLGDDVKTEMKAITSSTKRAASLAKKIKELEAAKAGADNKGEKIDFQKKIDEITSQLKAENQKITDEKNALINKHNLEMIDMHLLNSLTGFNYANDNLSKNLQLTLAKQVVTNDLMKEKAKLILENGQLIIKSQDDLDYQDAKNNKVNFQEFIERSLGANNLLKASDGADGGAGGGKTTVTIGADGKDKGNVTAAGLTGIALENAGFGK